MKDKIRITREQLDAIKAKHDETVGTPNFYKEGMLYRCASYSKNSKGSFFPVRNTGGKDWRKTELWVQLQIYLDENM